MVLNLKNAILVKTSVVKGFYYGFMPEVARHRRSVGEEVSEHKNYF